MIGRALALAMLALALASGCGSGGGSAGDAAVTSDGSDPGDPDFAVAPAFVHVVENSDNAGGVGATSITASFATDVADPYTEVARADGCRLLMGDPGLCQEPCDGFCVGDGECLPFPTRLSAGVVTVDGLTTALALSPMPGNTYGHFQLGAMMQPGTAVSASAPGDELGGFALSSPPAAPLVVTNYQGLETALEVGRPFAIEWEPSGDPGARVRLTINSDMASHGPVHPAVLECDVADTGRLDVPQALVDGIADPANWGCGDCAASSIERYHAARQMVGETDLELRTASAVGLYFFVF